MAEGNGKNGPGWTTAIVFSLLTMVVGAITTFYGTRDQSVAVLRAEIQARAEALRQEQRERFVGREEWANWKAENRARTDAQYFALMTALQRVGARLGR